MSNSTETSHETEKKPSRLAALLSALEAPERRGLKRLLYFVIIAVLATVISVVFIKAPKPAAIAVAVLLFSLIIVFLLEVWENLKTRFTRFLEGWGDKDTKDFRLTMWFFCIVLGSGLIIAGFYQTCCESCDQLLPAMASPVPAVRSNNVASAASLIPMATNSAGQSEGQSNFSLAGTNYPAASTAASRTARGSRRIQHVVTILLWSLACAACGAFAGFLFGIPKVLQSSGGRRKGTKNGPTASSASDDDQYRQQVNTNLTEISDWITKIIVGLGLINLKVIPSKILAAAGILCVSLQGCGPVGENLAFAVAVILFFSSIGFLFGYLMTRLFLAAAFSRADTGQAQMDRDAKEATIGSLLTEVSYYKTADGPPGSGSGPVPPSTETPPPSRRAPSVEADIKKAINHGLAADKIEDVKQKGIAKTQAANQIARLVENKDMTRDELVDRAIKAVSEREQDPLIAGLAVAVTISPHIEDLDRLARVAVHAAWPNTRYKLADALGRLFSERIASSDDVPKAQNILATMMVRNKDEDVRQRLLKTAALITQRTGVPLNLPGA